MAKFIATQEATAVARAAAASAEIAPEAAVKILKGLIAAAAMSTDMKAELALEFHDPTTAKATASGIPCIVCINYIFGKFCLIPPGGDC